MTDITRTRAGVLAAVAAAGVAGWLAAQPARRRIERAARTDPLTGLANRAGLFHQISRLGLAGGAVMLLDLDAFKAVNDTHGHAAGDVVLAVTAARLQTLAPARSVVARLGGDEFVAAIPAGTDIAALARTMRTQLAAPIPIAADMAVSVGASIGVAAGARRLLDGIRDADIAMYRAKGNATGVQISPSRPVALAPVRAAARRRDRHRHAHTRLGDMAQ